LDKNVKNIDWEAVAQCVPSRSAFECKLQWLNNNHPSINHGAWTAEEEKRLIVIAKEHKEHDWESISQELGVRNQYPHFAC
jgi:myb proto-oncogene protein